MKREVQAVLLVLVGGAVLRISIGDEFLRYVKEGMRPWLLVSGGLLVVLGVMLLVDVLRAARHDAHAEEHHHAASADDDPDAAHIMAPDLDDVDAFADAVPGDDDGHGHAHGGPRSAWLLLLPVLAIFLVAPPALGAYTAEREGQAVLAPATPEAPPLPAGDPVSLSLADYASRAVWDDGRTLAGRTVKMTGFATPDGDGGWWLTRLQLTCCAADAIATKIKPVPRPGGVVEPLPADAWVTVIGQWVPGGGTQSEKAIPWVQVDTLARVPAPKNPYE